MFEEPVLTIGLPIVFFDDGKCPHAAIVAFIYTDEKMTGARPRIVLSWLGYDGRWKQKTFCEPAYHNGELWVLLEKWAFQGEVQPCDYE